MAETIAATAIPLPDIEASDFARAFDRFADRRIVMLGECSHGTHEFYGARAAITRHFVEHHGLTIVAVEGDWPDAAAYDRFVRCKPPRQGAPPPFQRFPTWMWRNPVMPELLRELRALNEGKDEAEQAGFYGLGMYNMSGSIAAVLPYLDQTDPEAAATACERYGCQMPWQADPATYGRASFRGDYAACEAAVVAQCRDLIERALEQRGGAAAAVRRLCVVRRNHCAATAHRTRAPFGRAGYVPGGALTIRRPTVLRLSPRRGLNSSRFASAAGTKPVKVLQTMEG